MKEAIVELTSKSPISFSWKHNTPKLPRESPAAYEERTWLEKLHCNKEGQVVVEAIMIKNALANVAAFLQEKVPGGKGGTTFTKHFLSGILVLDDMPLFDWKMDKDGNRIEVPILKKDFGSIMLNVSSTGKRGGTGGKRVDRIWPIIYQWHGLAHVTVLDHIITQDIFERHFDMDGKFIGFGRFRPQNGGTNGRFETKLISFA